MQQEIDDMHLLLVKHSDGSIECSRLYGNYDYDDIVPFLKRYPKPSQARRLIARGTIRRLDKQHRPEYCKKGTTHHFANEAELSRYALRTRAQKKIMFNEVDNRWYYLSN